MYCWIREKIELLIIERCSHNKYHVGHAIAFGVSCIGQVIPCQWTKYEYQLVKLSWRKKRFALELRYHSLQIVQKAHTHTHTHTSEQSCHLCILKTTARKMATFHMQYNFFICTTNAECCHNELYHTPQHTRQCRSLLKRTFPIISIEIESAIFSMAWKTM